MPPVKSNRNNVTPYTTKDGSIIRELMHPAVHGGGTQMSLAEACVPAGSTTRCHIHIQSEEIYYIQSGKGEMILGDEHMDVRAGDAILIPPNTPHWIINKDGEALIFLCCCSPPYDHGDTTIIK